MKPQNSLTRQSLQFVLGTLIAITLAAPTAWAGGKGVRSTSRGAGPAANRNAGGNRNVNQNQNRNVNVNQNVNKNVNVNANVNRHVDVDVDVHHHGGYYHDNGHFWGGFATGLVIGAVIASPPPHPQTVVVQNTTYIVSEGVYMQPSGTGYVVVNPPIGVTVTALPPGATQTTVNGQVYFLSSGIYYLPAMQNGVTVYTTVKL